jgi:hypothetical protein
LAGETFNALARYSQGRKFAQAEGLASAAAAVLPRVLQWFTENAPARWDTVSAQLKGLQGPLGELSKAWLAVRDGQLKDLLVNGDFETTGPNQAKTEKDWSTRQAPPGWSTWTTPSRPPRFIVASNEGVHRSRGAGIANAASACFLQSLSVKPGQRYFCCVQARRTPPGEQGDVTLSVRWRRSNGAWLEPRTNEGSVNLSASANDFEPLMLLVTVPPRAGKLTLLLSAKALGDGVAAWFDNTAVYGIGDLE